IEPEPFGWEGEFYQYRAVSIWPRPMQKPHPKILMSGSNEFSARNAAKKGAMFGVANLTSLENSKKLIDAYLDEARCAGWEPGPEDLLISLTTSIDEDVDLAKERLKEGRRYFAEVLGGGIRTAQRLVLQKSRYMDDETKKNFVGANKQAKISVDDLIESGTVVCGTPKQAIEQIKNCHKILGHGLTNISMKVGNIEDIVINKQIEIFGNKVLPYVKHL
ncbi:LLM class flavin-dependent oxidoreductase, partial [Alphaproteobacteria bacterium]|nr:LLM class flavin-dependent oxidoreductase [Alphaproteobacteria bacterium]